MSIETNPAVFIGLMGFGALNIVSLYTGAAPKLADIRGRTEGDDVARQQLLDTDILIGGATVGVSLASTYALKSGWPILFLLGAFLLVAGWYHLVLNSPSVKDNPS